MSLQRLKNKETCRSLELKYNIKIKDLLKYDKNIIHKYQQWEDAYNKNQTQSSPKRNIKEIKNLVQSTSNRVEATFPPKQLKHKLEAQDDYQVLNEDETQAIFDKEQGGLRWGQSYKVLEDGIKIYRVWNSTNPNSKTGNWWSFVKPDKDDSVSVFRKKYVVCPEWSPLDRMITGTLKKGSIIVLGSGQSGKCNPFLTYEESLTQQVYVLHPKEDIKISSDTMYSTFGWKKIK